MSVVCFVESSSIVEGQLHYAAWAASALHTDVQLAMLFDPSGDDALGPDRDAYGMMNPRGDLVAESHLPPVDTTPEEQSAARSLLTAHARTIRNLGISDVHTQLVFESPRRHIRGLRSAPDLVVRHQRIGEELRRDLRDAAREHHFPILAAGDCYAPVRRALVAYDGSAATGLVIRYLAESVLLSECDLDLVFVGEAQTQAAHLRDAARRLRAAGRTVTTRTEPGQVGVVIPSLLADPAFDLLVIGSSGRGSIRERFGANTTTRLLRANPKPTLIVR